MIFAIKTAVCSVIIQSKVISVTSTSEQLVKVQRLCITKRPRINPASAKDTESLPRESLGSHFHEATSRGGKLRRPDLWDSPWAAFPQTYLEECSPTACPKIWTLRVWQSEQKDSINAACWAQDLHVWTIQLEWQGLHCSKFWKV